MGLVGVAVVSLVGVSIRAAQGLTGQRCRNEPSRILPAALSLRRSIRWALLIFASGAGVGGIALIALVLLTPGLPTVFFRATTESISGRFEQYRGFLGFDVLVIFVNNLMISILLALTPVFIASVESLLKARPPTSPIRRLDAFLDRLAARVAWLFTRDRTGSSASMRWRYPLLAIPALILVLNGVLLGFFTTFAALRGLERLVLLVVLIAPHGALEIPGFLLAGGLGHWSAWRGHLGASGEASGTRPWHVLRAPLWRHTVSAVTALMALSAVVETYVTPSVPRWLGLA